MKNYLLFMLALLISCGPPTQAITDNTQIVQNMFDAFNAHDWQKMVSFYAPGALYLDPGYGTEPVTKTPEEIIAKYTELQSIFPNLHDEIIGMYASGDKVTVEFVATGTAEDGTAFRLPIAAILTIKDGKIVRDATYYDQTE